MVGGDFVTVRFLGMLKLRRGAQKCGASADVDVSKLSESEVQDTSLTARRSSLSQLQCVSTEFMTRLTLCQSSHF